MSTPELSSSSRPENPLGVSSTPPTHPETLTTYPCDRPDRSNASNNDNDNFISTKADSENYSSS